MARSSRDLLDEARRFIPEVTPQQMRAEPGRFVIDVRERNEFEEGHVPGAVHLSKGFIETRIEDLVPDRETPITLYCAAGVRSLLAARAIRELGYTDVQSLGGGFGAWKQAGYDFVVPKALTAQQKQRYSRHLLIPEIGEEGQRKLLDARVLIIGAGGLGSPTALYLAAEVMLVTPLRDGMNLVAKEYVACRNDENGTLVLSEFTGAADELAGAFLVNPHDIEGLKDAIVRAANTSPAEARRRMRAMRKRVREHDVARWAASFLDTLSGAPGSDQPAWEPEAS